MWHASVMPAIAWLQMHCQADGETGRQSMCLWKANGRGIFIHRGRSKEAWVDHRAARSIMDDAYGACKNKRPGHSSVQVDPEVVAKLDEVRKMKGVTPRAVSDEDRSGGPDWQICKGFSSFTLPPRDQIVTATSLIASSADGRRRFARGCSSP